jgi:hypothetical protein
MALTQRIRRETIFLVLLICFCAGTATASGDPCIAVDAVEHDLGDVQAGLRVEKRFVITNKGNALLVIDNIKTSCGCTAAVADNQEVPPGGNTGIIVSYDATGLSAGKKTQSVFIHSNDPKKPVEQIRIFATVVHDVSLEPQNLITKLASFQGHVTFSLVAKNASDRPVALEVSKTEGAIGTAVLAPAHTVVEPKSEKAFTIEVTISDEEKRDLYVGRVLIATDHPKENEIVLRCLIKVPRVR